MQSFGWLEKRARRIVVDRRYGQVRDGAWLDWTGMVDAGRFGVVVLCHAISRALCLLHSCIDFHTLEDLQSRLQPHSLPEMRTSFRGRC